MRYFKSSLFHSTIVHGKNECFKVSVLQFLTSDLMSSLDLTNLLGVLIRFRQDKVAFMGDIESMFYQVMVVELSKISVWENDDLGKPPVDFEILVHIEEHLLQLVALTH